MAKNQYNPEGCILVLQIGYFLKFIIQKRSNKITAPSMWGVSASYVNDINQHGELADKLIPKGQVATEQLKIDFNLDVEIDDLIELPQQKYIADVGGVPSLINHDFFMYYLTQDDVETIKEAEAAGTISEFDIVSEGSWSEIDTNTKNLHKTASIYAKKKGVSIFEAIEVMHKNNPKPALLLPAYTDAICDALVKTRDNIFVMDNYNSNTSLVKKVLENLHPTPEKVEFIKGD